MRQRKYIYLLVLQGNYGHGWEDLTAEDKHSGRNEYGTPWLRIRQSLKDYRKNEGGTYRIIERRELNQDYSTGERHA